MQKESSTTSNSRHLGKPTFGNVTGRGFGSCAQSVPYSMQKSCCLASSPYQGASTEQGIAFLNHKLNILLEPATEDGIISISRSSLGNGGTVLQLAVFSGEQAVSKSIVINPKDDEQQIFAYNDLRQKESSNMELVHHKVISKLSPNEKLTLNTNEFETIDSFEKLFDTIQIISIVGDQFAQEFEFLKNWYSLDTEKKLELHEKKVSYELNLWLKNKDPEFFQKFVKPAIKV